jgi:glycine betaine/proline transport system substrate-binding protein
MMRTGLLLSTAAALVVASLSVANAADPAGCQTPRFSDIGWTDVSLTTALSAAILEGLGYTPTIDILGLDITYRSMKNKDIDIFLGSWTPGLSQYSDPYYADKSIETVAVNLTGTKWTWAVPKYVYDAGVKSFADLEKFHDKFQGKIYGTEPGGNKQMEKAIADNAFGLGKWELVESSEAGMLSQVARAVQSKDWIVFVAWQPHPMNKNFQLEYLSGGDDYYGPNFGASEVRTDVRMGYLQECPNVGQFLKNLKFTVDMENTAMDYILNDGLSPKDAALRWLKENPTWLDSTLANVTAMSGEPGLPAVKTSLGF